MINKTSPLLSPEEQDFDAFLDALVQNGTHLPSDDSRDPELQAFAVRLHAVVNRSRSGPLANDPVLARLLEAHQATGNRPEPPHLRVVRDQEPVQVLPRQSARRRRILTISNWAAVLVLGIVSVSLFALTMNWGGEPSGESDPINLPLDTVDAEWILVSDNSSRIAPAGLAIAPDGNLWIPNWSSGQIDIYSPDGNLIESWGEPGEEPGQFRFADDIASTKDDGNVIGIAWDADGNIYVADRFNNRIQKFGPDRAFLLGFDAAGAVGGIKMVPFGIALGTDGSIYVADAASETIKMFGPNGESLGFFVGGSNSDGPRSHRTAPGQPVVSRDGTIWAPDCRLDAVSQFSSDKSLMITFGSSGSEPGQFNCPRSLAIDDQGRIFVADYGNNRIQVLDANGNVLAVWTILDDGSTFQPFAVAIGGNDSLYVLDAILGRIIKIPIPENLPE